MSIKFISEFITDIYIKRELINNIDFNNKDILEKYLKNLFKTLNNKYNIKIVGYYDITIYIDKYYGIIVHLEREDLEYYDYFSNQIDMKILIKDIDFLYEVEDIPKFILNKVKVIIESKKIFLKIEKPLTDLEMMKLLEISKIYYKSN